MHSGKCMWFYFFNWTPSKKLQVKITPRSKVFQCNVTFDKLSKLGQISVVINYYIEIKDSLYLGKSFVNIFENWYQMRKIIAWHLNFKCFVKYLEEGAKQGSSLTSLSQILQSSFKAICYDQTTIESSKLRTMYIFKVKNLIFHHFSKIWKFSSPCNVTKWTLGQKVAKFVQICTVIKRSNSIAIVFLRLVIHFWEQFFKIMILWPIPNPSSF